MSLFLKSPREVGKITIVACLRGIEAKIRILRLPHFGQRWQFGWVLFCKLYEVLGVEGGDSEQRHAVFLCSMRHPGSDTEQVLVQFGQTERGRIADARTTVSATGSCFAVEIQSFFDARLIITMLVAAAWCRCCCTTSLLLLLGG